MKKILTIAGGTLLGAAFLWLAARNVDLARLAALISAASPAPLALMIFTVACELAIRGVKWSLLMRPAGRTRAWDAARLEAAALALNNVLPLRLGELARAAYGAEFFNINILTIASTIAAEKILDIAALLTLALLAAGASVLSSGPVNWRTAAIAAALLAIALASLRPLAARYPRLRRALDHLLLGLKALGRPGDAALVYLLALLQWCFNALNYYWVALALGLGAAITPLRCALLSFTGAAGSSVPGMPGYFGSFELAVASVAQTWGVSREQGLAYAALGHIMSYLITTAIGLFFLYQLGHSLGAIWRRFSSNK